MKLSRKQRKLKKQKLIREYGYDYFKTKNASEVISRVLNRYGYINSKDYYIICEVNNSVPYPNYCYDVFFRKPLVILDKFYKQFVDTKLFSISGYFEFFEIYIWGWHQINDFWILEDFLMKEFKKLKTLTKEEAEIRDIIL